MKLVKPLIVIATILGMTAPAMADDRFTAFKATASNTAGVGFNVISLGKGHVTAGPLADIDTTTHNRVNFGASATLFVTKNLGVSVFSDVVNKKVSPARVAITVKL